MNKIMKLIGNTTTIIAWIITMIFTAKTMQIIIFMPIVLMSMINEGSITQIYVGPAMKNYAFYAMTMLGSWLMIYTQKNVIEKSQAYLKIKAKY